MGWEFDLSSFPTKNRTICLMRAFYIPSPQDFKPSLHADDLQALSLGLTSVRNSWTHVSHHLLEVSIWRSHRYRPVNRTQSTPFYSPSSTYFSLNHSCRSKWHYKQLRRLREKLGCHLLSCVPTAGPVGTSSNLPPKYAPPPPLCPARATIFPQLDKC